jgi:hypothetical protein
MIGPNPNTTANAKGELWAAARKGRAAAQRRVTALRNEGQFTADVAVALLAEYDHLVEQAEVGQPDRYRWSAARSYVVAAAATHIQD